MLTLLAGLGLAFAIFVIIVSVYSVADIVGMAVEHEDKKMSASSAAFAIAHLVLIVVVGVAILTGIGWLILRPLLPLLSSCG